MGILFAIIAPILFTQNWTSIDFTETGEIGDTIGGITAPIIGVLSILLLFYTLWEQVSFNKKQKELSNDEQFKSTFFNLLQAQREIIEKIAGNFKHLGLCVYEEYPKNNNDIKITRNNKEFATIHNCKKTDNAVRGLDFFMEAKYQLFLIYEALDNERFIDNYDTERAYEMEMDFQEDFYHGDNVPIEIQKEQDRKIREGRKLHRIAYTNDMYGISEDGHTPYRQMSEDKKIGLGYAYFFYKYESVGYYFRHIYRILKFIKNSEDEKIKLIGKNISQSDKDNVHRHFKEYAQFIQAQMSTDELLLLFYNSFAFEKAQKLIIHYDLLENLTVQNLIKKEHNCKPELKLKNKSNLFFDLINKNRMPNA